ncbi:MAG: hypothetical protein R2750_12920 [Bacteroidales bacterium]
MDKIKLNKEIIKDLETQLRKRAKKFRIRANLSLGLIIVFISVGIYIFYSANTISTVATENQLNKEIENLRNYNLTLDSINTMQMNEIMRQRYENRAIMDSIQYLIKSIDNQKN